MGDFTVEISQNEYLAEGAEDVNAIVTVTSPDTGLAAPVDDQGSAEIIIIDCSGSMRSPRTKIEQVRVTPAGVGQEMLAARVSLVAATPSGPDVLGQGLVRAIWTDDEALSTRINGSVAHYTGQAELAQVIQEGLEARKQGDEDTATAKLGRAVALAEQSGNEGTAKLLAKVVDVVDAASGTVQLKKRVDDADEMALDTRSTKTVRTKK
jgi:hypothetical protein